MEAALDLLRRLPPSAAAANLAALRELLPPGAGDALLGASDQPLAVKFDEAAHREFVACEYNRDGDSHRSPWTNAYVPAREGGFLPGTSLRELELQANEVFNEYRRMYYGGGVSSVYLWGVDGGGFAGSFVVKKEVEGEGLACWDAIHLVTVAPVPGAEAFSYRLSSTLLLSASAAMRRHGRGEFTVDGALHRSAAEECALGEGHIANIGRMIERTETNVRNMLGEVYFGKTRDVVHVLREPEEQIRHRGL